jgi:hypothetical protein
MEDERDERAFGMEKASYHGESDSLLTTISRMVLIIVLLFSRDSLSSKKLYIIK